MKVKLRDEEGKLEWSKLAKAVIVATIPFVIMWGAYVTFQAYEVGSNKKAIQITAKGLREDIDDNSAAIDRWSKEIKGEVDKNNSVLHQRITMEVDRHQAKINHLQNLLMKTWGIVIAPEPEKQNTPQKSHPLDRHYLYPSCVRCHDKSIKR